MLAEFNPEQQQAFLQMLLGGSPLQDIFGMLVRVAEERFPEVRCSILLQEEPVLAASDVCHASGWSQPIVCGAGTVVGQVTLSLQDRPPSAEHRRLLEGLAQLAALAYDRHLIEQARAERERLAALATTISRALTARCPLPDILHQCADALVRHLDVALARIWVLEEEEGMLVLAASAGLSTNLHGSHSRVPVGTLKIGQIAQDRRPRLTNRILEENWMTDKAWAEREGLVAFVGYPLIAEDRVAGVMAMFARHLLSERILDELGAIAGGIAQCIIRIQAEQHIQHLHADLAKQFDALRESREQLRGIVEAAADGIITINEAGTIESVNPATERIFGYSQAELLGRHVNTLMPSHYHEAHEKAFMNYLKTGQGPIARIGSREFVGVRKDGRLFPLELTVSETQQSGRRFFTGVIRDISDRKHAEEALRQSELRLRQQNKTLVFLAKTTLAMSKDLRSVLIDITEAAARTLNVERVSVWVYAESRTKIRCLDLYERTVNRHSDGLELSALQYPRYFHALESERSLAAHDARSDTRTSELREAYLLPLGIRAMLNAPIRLQGRLIGVVCHEHVGSERQWSLDEQSFAGSIADLVSLAMEILERKQVEAEVRRLLQEAELREQALREKQAQLVQAAKLASIGELATGIAHELNNPLNNIALFVGNALDSIERGMAGRKLKEPLAAQLQGAMHQISRAAKIINHLRLFARTAKMDYEPVTINEVITSALAFVAEQLRLADIDLEVDLPADPLVRGNRIQLEQVFVNLLTNARDALEQAPVKRLSITSRLEPGFVEVRVQDTGVGIPAELLPRIFDPFFTTKDVGVGTGLGLSITYGIIKEHEGQITVESQPGQGTTFMIRLPLLQAQPADHVSADLRAAEA